MPPSLIYLSTFLSDSRICHCITASLSILASNATGAEIIMNCPDDVALQTLLVLSEAYDTPTFERAGHVKAAACASVAFLACHHMGAKVTEPYLLP